MTGGTLSFHHEGGFLTAKSVWLTVKSHCDKEHLYEIQAKLPMVIEIRSKVDPVESAKRWAGEEFEGTSWSDGVALYLDFR